MKWFKWGGDMNKMKADKILGGDMDFGFGFSMSEGDIVISLDGDYSADELEAIAWYLRNKTYRKLVKLWDDELNRE